MIYALNSSGELGSLITLYKDKIHYYLTGLQCKYRVEGFYMQLYQLNLGFLLCLKIQASLKDPHVVLYHIFFVSIRNIYIILSFKFYLTIANI